MNWRLAKSLIQLRSQVNEDFPNRDKESDGTVGDASHQSRKSDHDPNEAGVVTAWDCDADLSPTKNVGILVAALVDARDPRVKYIIWNRRMIRSYPAHGLKAWEWGPYNGVNAHQHHAHISVSVDPKLYDDPKPWILDFSAPAVETPPGRDLKQGMTGFDITALQSVLKIPADGKFGPKTLAAVKAFQSASGLAADGIVGKNTKAALGLK